MAKTEDKLKELETKIDALTVIVERLEPLVKAPSPVVDLTVYELTEPDRNVLSLIAMGFTNEGASKAFGYREGFVHKRLKDSVKFTEAYQKVRQQMQQWSEARVAFTVPLAWAVIDQILMADIDTYLDDEDPAKRAFARTLLQMKAKAAKDVLRLGYAPESKLVVEHTLSEPLMQVKERSLDLVAERMRQLEQEATAGLLEARLPEMQVVDGEYIAYEGNQPVDWKGQKLQCLECLEWYRVLATHIIKTHGMSIPDYRAKHNIPRDIPLNYLLLDARKRQGWFDSAAEGDEDIDLGDDETDLGG